MTLTKLETVRVKHKGQITIPAEVRRQYEIKEGDLLDIERGKNTIILKKKKLIEPGLPIGFEKQKRIMNELRKTRENW